jgi:hypothetical protein
LKSKTKTKRTLESFSKETLVAYIKRRCLHRISEIETIERDMLTEKHLKECDELLIEMENVRNKNTLEGRIEWIHLNKKHDKISAKLDKLIGLDKK